MCYITIHRTLCDVCHEVLEYRKSVDETCYSKLKTDRCNIQAPPSMRVKHVDSSNCLACNARRASVEAARKAERERRELKRQMELMEQIEADKIKREGVKAESMTTEDIIKEEEEAMEAVFKKAADAKVAREKNGRVEEWIDEVLELRRKPGGKKE